MKDYYLLVGLNSKEVKITKVNQNEKGVLEIKIENKNKKVDVLNVINLQVQYIVD